MSKRDYRRKPIPDDMIYAVCERFLKEPGQREFFLRHMGEEGDRKSEAEQDWNAETLAIWLTKQGYRTSREGIFPIVRQAIRRGFVQLHPPRSYRAKTMLAERYPNMPADTTILDIKPELAGDNLATTTALTLLRLIRELGPLKERKFSEEKAPSPRVHLGFGAGAMTWRVADKLALALETEADLPAMTFHALSSGFSNNQPLSAPVAFFPAFSKLNQPIEFVGLFAPPFVKLGKYDEIKDLPAIKESFLEAKKIDIVVTSLAQADDEHGLLNSFLAANKGGKPVPLEDAGHIGDVQWHPFSESDPLTNVDTGIRAVTLFDLPDLVKLARTEDRHVVLVAGPCSVCRKTKAKALRPLLTQRSLRVCNHLVTDVATAGELLGLDRPSFGRTGREHHVD
jgi:hypothetical protein